MAIDGVYLKDLTAATDLDGKLGLAENADGSPPGYNLLYSKDGTLADNSDGKVPTQKAVKTYADTKVNKTLTQNHIYLGDATNVAVPSVYTTIDESVDNQLTIETSKGTLGAQFKITVDSDTAYIPTTDQKAALDGANTPSALNVFATMSDIPASELTADELAAIQGANTPSALNVFATMTDIPADELTADELAAIQGANTPSALNVFATMTDIPAAELTTDELAAIQGANTPSALNVFATMDDLSGTVVPSGQEDSSNANAPTYFAGMAILTNGQTAFTLSATPIAENVFSLYLNGKKASVGPTVDNSHDYTRSGTAITWNNSGPSGSLATTDELIAQYNIVASGAGYFQTGNIAVSTWTAPANAATPTTNIRLVRVGKLVTLHLASWSAAGDGSAGAINSVSAVIPAEYRPSQDTYGIVLTQLNSSTYSAGEVQVLSTGAIVVWGAPGSQFSTTSGEPFGFRDCSVSWLLI